MKNPLSDKSQHNDLPPEAKMLRGLAKDKNNFIVPANYFETFPNQLEHLLLTKKGVDFKVNESYFEELPEKIKVLTLQEKAENNPIAPDGYFDKLPRILQDKVHTPIRRESRIPGYSLAGLALAACVVLVIMVIKPFEEKPIQQIATKPLAQLSKVEINTVVENEVFDESTLLEAVSDWEETPPEENALTENTSENSDSEEIANYLMEQNIDLNTLVNEL